MISLTTNAKWIAIDFEYYLDGQKTHFLIQTYRLTLTNQRKYNSAKL
jgi:hypothetical protein